MVLFVFFLMQNTFLDVNWLYRYFPLQSIYSDLLLIKKKIVFQFHDVIIVILASVPLRETPSLLHRSSVSRQVLGPLCQGSFSPCAEISFQDQCRMLSQAFYAAIEII